MKAALLKPESAFFFQINDRGQFSHDIRLIRSKSLFQHFGGVHKHKALTLLPLHSLSTRLQRALRTSL